MQSLTGRLVVLTLFAAALAAADALIPLMQRYAIDNFIIKQNIEGTILFLCAVFTGYHYSDDCCKADDYICRDSRNGICHDIRQDGLSICRHCHSPIMTRHPWDG